jgi:antirestriction protein ArdC
MADSSKVHDATSRLLALWASGEMPAAIATLTIRRQAGDPPSDSWSLGNRLLVFMADTEDARGFRQWEQAGRHVVKGARAIHILGPIARKVHGEDPDTAEPTERTIIRGFKAIPVFRLEDTDGEALQVPDHAPPVLPPLAEVAEAWGIKVAYRPDRGGGYYGAYSPTTDRIELVTHAEATFFHELAHAAHRRLGGITSAGQDSRQEIVAETSAAALCLMYGLQAYATPAAQYVAAYAGVGADDAARGALRHLSESKAVLELILGAAQASWRSEMELPEPQAAFGPRPVAELAAAGRDPRLPAHPTFGGAGRHAPLGCAGRPCPASGSPS